MLVNSELYGLIMQAANNLKFKLIPNDDLIEIYHIQLIAEIIVKNINYLNYKSNLETRKIYTDLDYDDILLKSNQEDADKKLFEILQLKDEDGMIRLKAKEIIKLTEKNYSKDTVKKLIDIFKINNEIIELRYQMESYFLMLNESQVNNIKIKLDELEKELNEKMKLKNYKRLGM